MKFFLAMFLVFIVMIIMYYSSKKPKERKIYGIIIKIFITIGIVLFGIFVEFAFSFSISRRTYIIPNLRTIISYALVFIMTPLFIISVWYKKRRVLMVTLALLVFFTIPAVLKINDMLVIYDDSKIVNLNVNINVSEYQPFVYDTKIVRLDHEPSMMLEGDLPVIDGAAAVVPVYSAFMNAVYPAEVNGVKTELQYNNTQVGYRLLADKKIDVFFGAYPSESQIAYAKKKGTEFEYTEIGKEGFVFIVNKENPIESLTEEQIKGIYSGKIKNWKELGGNSESIKAFQRNEGSGSQSMLIRFMDGTPIMDAPSENKVSYMGLMADVVADYRNYSNSIGYSFRYYIDTLIANPNLKMISINGIAPTKENITNGTYPIITPLYAVTYKGNDNENVQKLIDWVLSDEGQEIIDKTGYARVK